MLFVTRHRSRVGTPLGYMEDFNDYCREAQIDDLRYSGFHMTWDNKGYSDRLILRKLDRVLINPTWSDNFPNSEAIFLPPRASDHSAL